MSWFKQNAPPEQGSLAALGGGTGRNAPIYNPVQPPQKFPGQQPSPDFPIASAGKIVSGDEPMWPGGPSWNQMKQRNGGSLMPAPQPWTPNEHWNGPQPVPGMPPKQFDPNTPAWTPPEWGDPSTWQHLLDGGSEGPGGIGGHNDQPNWQPPWMQGNRGSGQPINQPMGPPGSQGGPLPADAGPMPQFGPYGGGYDQNTHQWVNNTNPVGIAPTPRQMGSLQSLGGGQLNQSGMVTLRGPDGSSKAVPQDQVSHWMSKGAVRM